MHNEMPYERFIQLIINWTIFLTSPLWVIPVMLYFEFRDSSFIGTFFLGVHSIFRSQDDGKTQKP